MMHASKAQLAMQHQSQRGYRLIGMAVAAQHLLAVHAELLQG
jgi:hypothetical protein